MYDVIIVGSGASGVASALELVEHGIKPLILDVGYTADKTIDNPKNLYTLKEERNSSNFLIGENFEYFQKDKQKLPAKLKSPYFDFVTKNQPFFKVHQNNYNAITSYAKGGLANAWGNGLMRFSKDEFDYLPISFDDLKPYYEKLEKEIGISGRNDDLINFFGECTFLQEPLNRSEKAEKIFSKYNKNKKKLNEEDIFMGTPRIGVSNNNFDVRNKCNYDNLEFWEPNHKSLYNPSMTLDKLIFQGLVEYKSNMFVDIWKKESSIINVITYNVITKEKSIFQTKKLILASGTLNTSRIVLKSRNDYKTQLRFLDNPAIQIPIFFPSYVGKNLQTDSFGLSQLNILYKSTILNKFIIGAILEITSPLRNEFLDKFPFVFRNNIESIKYFLPSMMAIQIFLPSDDKFSAKLSLKENGDIFLDGNKNIIDNEIIDEAISKLKRLGLLTHRSLAIKVSNGNGIHYGGTLAMTINPTTPYQTNEDGELSFDKNIFIVDGSCFGNIPATNYSLSIMANSMRISNKVAKL